MIPRFRSLPRTTAAALVVCFGTVPVAGGAGVASPAAAASASPPPRPAALVAERPGLARPGYWTKARMSAARLLEATRTPRRGHRGHRMRVRVRAHAGRAAAGAVDGARWAGGGVVARSTGRVFFTMDGTDYACSGSVVDGARADVVITAAHCVSDGAGGWAENWMFIPGYAQGRAPFGRYPARVFLVAGPWANGADEDDDVAFVTVGTARVAGAARHVEDVAGGQPIAFGNRTGRADVFGYPAKSPYTGGRLDYCTGPLLPDPYGAADAGIACKMTEGDSGGPWLSGFNRRTGLGTITGVSSFKYSGATRILYSANLGTAAQDLYARAEQDT